jgi:hypothetical protein
MPRKYDPSKPNYRKIGLAPVKDKSLSHIALCFMKVTRRPITLEQLKSFNPVKFAKARNSDLDRLVDRGFAVREGQMFAITNIGIKAIYETANHTRLKRGNRPMEDD